MKFAVLVLASAIFFAGMQLRGISLQMARVGENILHLDSAVRTQTNQHSYLAKRYAKPILPSWEDLALPTPTDIRE